MIVTESGYSAYQIKRQITISLPKDYRKMTDKELASLVDIVKKLHEGEQDGD